MTARRLLTAAVWVLLASAPAPAQTVSELVSARGKSTSPFASIVAKANESTVRVRCDDKDTVFGTVVFADGYILTKASELKGRVTVRMADGTEQDAEIVAVHTPTDLALVKVEADDLHPVSFSPTKKVPVGIFVAAASAGPGPQSVGIVSVATRNLRGYLGVFLARVDPEKGGAKVDDIAPSGAAETAGLKKGDVICELNGKTITGEQALRRLLETYKPGDEVKLKLQREGKEIEKKLTLGGPGVPPTSGPNRGDIQNTLGNHRLSTRRTGFPTILQTDMILKPEQCGGPVVDLDGKVLGVSIARAGRVETWVLPSETITPLLADMKSGKYPPVSLKKDENKADKKDDRKEKDEK
jgi:serine protease Do